MLLSPELFNTTCTIREFMRICVTAHVHLMLKTITCLKGQRLKIVCAWDFV
jgi:hypothetical protein